MNFIIKNYFTIAWRNLLKIKISSLINHSGFAIGIAVPLMIGLWVWDELSFNTYHENYSRIAQVMEKENYDNNVQTAPQIPLPLGGSCEKVMAMISIMW
jgi:putative ABC transport system permease protein